MYETNIVKMRVEKMDLDMERQISLLDGTGIIIDNVEAYDKKGQKNYNGLQSSFFGSDFADDEAHAEKWSCQCKKYIGLAFAGHVCEECGTPVEFVDIDLNKMGWIVLNDFKVISPIYAAKLTDALGSSNGESILIKILDVDFGTKSGEAVLSEKDEKELKKHPYIKRGMLWFYDHYEEVLDFYAKKKPKKAKLFKELKMDKYKVFTSSIPVISSILRMELPGEKTKKLYKMKINTLYQSIIRSVNSINELGSFENMDDETKNTVDRYIKVIQSEILDLFQEIFKLLDGKKGVIQGKTISGRYNFSARNVIIPGSGYLRTDEILLCYISFMELYRYELINLYSKLYNCPPLDAQNKWKMALVTFDEIFYELMEYIIEKNKSMMNVLINRNPSINVGSFLGMRVIGVKKNINDKTLTIPNSVLKLIAGDYDGDQLNIYRIIGEDFGKKFMTTMNPRFNQYIDRINGNVNKDMMPAKDELTGFWQFNNI